MREFVPSPVSTLISSPKKPMEYYSLKLENKRLEYGDIYSFCFSSEKKLPYKAGQWVHLGFPGEEGADYPVRHMSFASAPSESSYLFSMPLNSGSWYKNRMAQLKPGDEVKAFKIKGFFTVDETDKESILFLAGGLGITPVRSIVVDMAKSASPQAWKLIHVSRDGFLYERELLALPQPQIRTDREGLDKALASSLEGHKGKVYISGSDGFVQGMKERLYAEGFDQRQLVTEDFD